jgi:hypothetical protein
MALVPFLARVMVDTFVAIGAVAMSRHYSNWASAIPVGADEYRLLMAAVLRVVRLAVMTSTIPGSSVACRTTRLVRRVGGVELPVPGAWVAPGHYASIAVCVPRSLRRSDVRMGRASEATIVIAEDPEDVFVAVLFDVPGLEITGAPAGALGPPIVLDARSVPGPQRWALSGELFSVEAVRPLRATLDYHGVWRRGDLSYGWFVLAGALDPLARTGRPMRFRFELLASGPDGGSRSSHLPSRASSVAGSQMCGTS